MKILVFLVSNYFDRETFILKCVWGFGSGNEHGNIIFGGIGAEIEQYISQQTPAVG